MNLVFNTIWILVIYVVTVKWSASAQFPVPVYQPSIYAMPAPPIQVMAVPAIIQMPKPTTTSTTTTTTTESTVALAVPIPVPIAVQMAIPAMPAPQFCVNKPRNKSCPPCPPCLCLPSCTPAFFSYCSPCHLKCRCRNARDTPIPPPPVPPQPMPGPAFGVPVPAPIIAQPPPVVVVPFPPMLPPIRRPPQSDSGTSVDSSSSKDTSSSSNEHRYMRNRSKHRKGRSKKRFRASRRSFGRVEVSDNEIVKPVLSYISKNGDVRLNRRLSRDEADQLLSANSREMINGRRSQRVQVIADNDPGNSRVVVLSNNERTPSNTRRSKQVILRKGSLQQMLADGKKELIFRAPSDKKISNLSVSFQIT